MKHILTFVLVFSGWICSAQINTIVNIYDHNKEIPGSVYKFSFVQLTDVHIGEGDSNGDYGTPGFLDETLPSEMGQPVDALNASIRWINQNHLAKNIKFVIITGDLSDSAEKSEFETCKSTLDSLDIPYVPLIGNHDVWPYIKGMDHYIMDEPKGDSLINDIFSDVFDADEAFFNDWDNGTRLTSSWNPEGLVFNNLQNYSFSYDGFYFLMCDFNPRYKARFPPGPGIGPDAQLNNFPGGTFPWLMNKVREIHPVKEESIFIASHHPPLTEPIGPNYSFDNFELDRLSDSLLPYKNVMGAWFAGHIHRKKSYYFSGANRTIHIMHVLESEANKEHDNGSMLLVNVYESPNTVGISQQIQHDVLKVYPNPNAGKFVIEIPANLEPTIRVEVMDLQGKLVYQNTFTNNFLQHLEIELNDVAKGNYILKMTSGDDTFTQNVVVE